MKVGNKGLSIHDLVSVVLAFSLIGIIGGMGLYLLSQVSTTGNFGTCQSGAANNYSACAVGNASSGISGLLTWLPILAVIVAAGVVIAVLVSAFAMKGRGV